MSADAGPSAPSDPAGSGTTDPDGPPAGPLSSLVARVGPARLAALAVSLLAGLVVFVLATELFPYHSSNHDEGVYLQQAALLLEGRLELAAGDLADAVRPWFFVEDGGRLYPKYTPVPAAMYAVSMALVGEPRATLAAVAAGNTLLVYALGSELVPGERGRRVGVVAAVVFAAAPMAAITSAVFLPYAPTTLWNLLFAVAYLRGVREGSDRRRAVGWAAVAGVAVGIAFFARPYTAVLFAAPFIAHALWEVAGAVRAGGVAAAVRRPLPDAVARNAVTAAGGTAFVCLTLAYNARLTGDPLTFPYEAFAPLDGPGFGYREILAHSVEYTPALALEANAYVLRYLATRWFTAGLLGTAAAAVGLAYALRDRDAPTVPVRRVPARLLAGLFLTVPLGNLFFWGNYNLLATMADPTDGIVAQFGPFYHFDLLVPLSVFAAIAVVAGWRRLRALVGRSDAVGPTGTRVVLAAAVLSALLVAGAANAAVVAEPLERNAAYTEKHETAYEPFADREFDGAVVFVPTPYGDWLNHPFQYLRNGGDLDGAAVYAQDRGPAGDFAVLDAYPDRTHYRYTYRGRWTADPDRRVTPKLERLSVRSGETVAAGARVGVPSGVTHATVRLEGADGEVAEHRVADPGDDLTVNWTLAPGVARLDAVDGDPADPAGDGDASVAVAETDEVVLLVRLTHRDGSTLTYRQEVTVRSTDGGVEAVWPPERRVCPLVDDCGRRGTYLPDRPDEHLDGVAFEVRADGEE